MENQNYLALPPKPSEYGLPYDEWREGQYEAITAAVEAFKTHDVVFLIADTGAGKSGIGVGVAHQYQTATMLTKTISLEEQYGAVSGMEVGRGRSWHDCLQGGDALECWENETCAGPCPYREHRERLARNRIRILNYAQFYAWNIKNGAYRSDLVVCDEGHGLESTLQGFAEMWYKDGVPTWGREVKHLLFPYGKKFLIMSASMIPALVAETVGIESYDVIEVDNHFPSDNSPIFVKPVGYITYNRPHTDRIVRFIDNHLDTTTFNGVIHTSSDRQTQEILDLTRHRDRFIWPKGKDRGDAFGRFKQPGNNKVLISASASEGQDFPDDECRWQIITKVPYADLSDETTRERRNERPDIYRLEALQRIQQACGRGMRHKEDWCANYILDATVTGLFDKFKWVMSSRFRDSWRGVV